MPARVLASDGTALSTYDKELRDASVNAHGVRQGSDALQSEYVQRGNEVLTVRSLYLQDKIRSLSKRISNGDHQAVAQELRDEGFCSDPDLESDGQCIDRYRKVTSLELQRVTSAIVSNNAKVIELNRADRKYIQSAIRPKDAGPMLQLQPSIKRKKVGYVLPSYAQLQAEYGKELERLDSLDGAQYDADRWLNQYQMPEPKLTDFVKYKEQARDPDDPSSDTLVSVDRSCPPPDGICYDQKAFETAIKEYELKKDQLKKMAAQVRKDYYEHLSRTQREPGVRQKRVEALNRNSQRYDRSVGITHQALKRAGVLMQEFPGAQREPSSTANGSANQKTTESKTNGYLGTNAPPGNPDATVDLKQSQELLDSYRKDAAEFNEGKK